MSNEPEQRKEPRVNKVLGAEIRSGEECMQARLFVINLSASGFRATCEKPLPEGDGLLIALKLDANEPAVEVTARLCWRKELTVSGMFDHGFEFTEIDERDIKRIRSFVQGELQKQLAHKPVDLQSPWKFGSV